MINHGTWGKTWKTSERGVRIIKWYTARSCIPNLHPILILILLLIIIILRDGLSAQSLLTVQSTTSKRAKAARSIWSCLSQGPDRGNFLGPTKVTKAAVSPQNKHRMGFWQEIGSTTCPSKAHTWKERKVPNPQVSCFLNDDLIISRNLYNFLNKRKFWKWGIPGIPFCSPKRIILSHNKMRLQTYPETLEVCPLKKPEDLNDSPQPPSQGALQFVRRPWLPEIHCNGPGSFPF